MMNYRKRLSISLLLVLGMVLSVSAAPRTKAAIKAAAEQVFSQSPTLRMTRAHKDDLKPLLKNSAYTVMGYKGSVLKPSCKPTSLKHTIS